jgi:hypothetical protein
MFDFTSRARTTSAAERTTTVHSGLALNAFFAISSSKLQTFSSEYAFFCGNLGNAPGERSYL